MTERLYETDPYLARFEAEVVAERRLGERPAVVLTRTAFYPEGGGQPSDRGTLGGSRVVDVQLVGGEILHAIEGTLPAGRVAGELDWTRRFDHMQQHHGQHLLSATFERLLAGQTVSFHLGERICSIDLDLSADRLKPIVLAEVERAANEVVWRDLPVEARELSAEELARLPLRKEPVKGSRVVMVEGVDRSPCGGTHPRRTGEVGAIAVLAAQKWGAGARVEFACGGRVTVLLRESAERLGLVAGALRCSPAEAPEAAARLAGEAMGRKKDVERLTVALAASEAERLGPRESPIVEELTPPPGTEAAVWLRAVAQALAGRGRLALLGARGGGRAYLCFARAKGAGPDMGAVLREAVATLGGKGGGAPELAQGAGPAAEKLPEALAGARARLTGT